MPEKTQQFAQNIARSLIGEEAAHPAQPLIQMQGIRKSYYIGQPNELEILHGIDLTVYPGEFVAIVGESGSGKSVTAMTIMGLISMPPGKIEGGDVRYRGRSILEMTEEEMQHIRGNDIAMIFQDPMSALNPVMTVGAQIMEVLKIHHPEQSTAQLEARVDEMMELVGIPAKRKVEYPHQFSGGMKQRIVIAIALACEPKLLIADEPTTALDVTISFDIHVFRRET